MRASICRPRKASDPQSALGYTSWAVLLRSQRHALERGEAKGIENRRPTTSDSLGHKR